MLRVLAVVIILPIVGAVIGYTTKWVSVQLIFKPARFVGLGPIGWQGVVQRRSPKFATGVAEMLDDVAPLAEIIDRVDPVELVDVMAESLKPVLDDLAPAVLESIRPGLWSDAAPEARQTMTAMLDSEARAALVDILEEGLPVLRDGLDITPMVIEMLSGENADRLARLVQTIASEQLRTVIRYGAVVGFFVGLAEAAVFLMFERWWLLPLIGALDGTINNYMGIQMIFRPLEPRRYFGLFEYQGLFPARQREIAHDYGAMMAAEVLTSHALADQIVRSPIHVELAGIIHDVLERRLGKQLEMLGPMFGVDPTPELSQKVVRAATHALGVSPESIVPDLDDHPAVVVYLEQRLDLARTIEQRLGAMSKLEFETILRGIFEEDEKVLVGIGAVIGALIGTLQAAIVLAL